MTIASNPTESNAYLPLRLAREEIFGMVPAYASTTTFTVTAGVCRDNANLNDIKLDSTATCNTANTGLNGIDTGAFEASKDYGVYAIAASPDKNGTSSSTGAPPGVMISLSLSGPTAMPVLNNIQYDMWRLIGFIKSNGSTQIIPFDMYGHGVDRRCVWRDAISVLVVSSSAPTTFTAADLSAGLPAYNKLEVLLQLTFTPSEAGRSVSFRPTGSAGTVVPTFSGDASDVARKGQHTVEAWLASGLPKVDYLFSNASDLLTAYVQSYKYSLRVV